MRLGAKIIRLSVAALIAVAFSVDARAQFKSEAFQQTYNDDKTTGKDSVDVMFSFKEYWGGIRHKNEIKIGTMAAGSALVPGGCQIYNKDYWKLPLVYGTIGGALGTGLYYKLNGNDDVARYCWIGAGVAYWTTMMDGVVNYQPSVYPHAGKATLYSILCPGLGQIYNREYWKLPIYLGGMAAAVYFYSNNRTNFERYRRIYLEATDPEIKYEGPVSADQALYYRNVYRRYRDYSILAIGVVYLLQVIDANVFTYMHNFEVDDDLAMKFSPTIIVPDNQFASSTGIAGCGAALGLRMGFTF